MIQPAVRHVLNVGESHVWRTENELAGTVPVVHCTIAGTKIVGRMTAGNKNGLLVPESTTEEEMAQLVNNLPAGVKVAKVADKLSALGNCIVCNDKVALVHPDMEPETITVIEQVLQVEVYRGNIAGNALVGSYLVLTNNGGLAHPLCSVAELDELSTLL